MIKDNQRAFNQIHILIDALLIAVCYLLSYVLRFDLLTVFDFFAIIVLHGKTAWRLTNLCSYITIKSGAKEDENGAFTWP